MWAQDSHGGGGVEPSPPPLLQAQVKASTGVRPFFHRPGPGASGAAALPAVAGPPVLRGSARPHCLHPRPCSSKFLATSWRPSVAAPCRDVVPTLRGHRRTPAAAPRMVPAMFRAPSPSVSIGMGGGEGQSHPLADTLSAPSPSQSTSPVPQRRRPGKASAEDT